MKRIFSLLLSAVILVGLYGCTVKSSSVILDNSDKSYFVDFYTEGDNVYIECVLNIYSEADTEVTIGAVDNDNVATGLLKSPELIGVDKADGDEVFTLTAGENKVSVLFKGEYAGVFSIAERDKPRFIEISER